MPAPQTSRRDFKVGVRVPAAGSIRQVVDTVRRAELAGLAMAYFPDSPLNYREVWSVLGAAALATDRIQLGVSVTNLVSRHISVTASAARAVSEAAPGRFMLGIGTGDSAVGFAGMRPSRVAEMEKGIVQLRALMRGDGVDFDGFEVKLRDADESPRIMLAASGPKTLAMGVRIADGILTPFGEATRKLAQLREAAAQAGKAAPPVYCSIMAGVITDRAAAVRAMKVFVARQAQLEGVAQFAEAGFTIDGEFLAHRMGADGDIGHAANVGEMAKRFDAVIGDDVAEWYLVNRTLLGSEAELMAGLDRMAAMGIAGVYLAQQENSVLPDALIEALAPVIRQREAA